MIFQLDGIHWAGLGWLTYAIGMLLFVGLCLAYKWYKFHTVIRRLVANHLRSSVLKNASMVRYVGKTILFFIGFLFLALGLLQPQWDKKEEVVEQEGRDVLIALDISRSMLAQDVKPNRLDFARNKIKKLLYNLSCERVGLILFSGTTVLQCPLTTDYAAFFMFLDQIDAETISSGTTTLDQAIRQAMAVYDTLSTRKTKIVCLFTDGEDFSTNLSGIKEKAAAQGLSIFTLGIGSEHGAPIPIIDQHGKQVGFEKDHNEAVIMSKLNEGILKNLSTMTGAQYFHATESDHDIAQLVKCVEKFEKDKMDDKTVDRLQEKYNYFVAVSFVCFALEWLL